MGMFALRLIGMRWWRDYITGEPATVDEDDYCPIRDELESIYAQLANECCSLSEDELDYLDRRREELEAELSQIQTRQG